MPLLRVLFHCCVFMKLGDEPLQVFPVMMNKHTLTLLTFTVSAHKAALRGMSTISMPVLMLEVCPAETTS